MNADILKNRFFRESARGEYISYGWIACLSLASLQPAAMLELSQRPSEGL